MVTTAPPPGFLDAASGQPLNPAAAQAWAVAAAAGWAEPTRLYGAARQADLLRQAAHESLAAGWGARPDSARLLAGGPDLAGRIARLCIPRSGTLVLSAVEHSSLLAAGDDLAAAGGQVRAVGVDRLGRVDPQEYAAQLQGADLACLQTANHEVGTRQPVAQIAEACAEAGVPLLLDASTSLGHDPVPAGWSVLVGQARSWGGPQGTGAVAASDTGLWRRITHPDAGLVTAPVAEAVTAARGWEWAAENRQTEADRARSLTASLRAEIVRSVPDVVPLGDPDDRLPHLIAFSCLYVDGEALVLGLDRAGYAISSGSSCVSDTRRPSHVLAAMGALTQGNVRVSLPYGVTDETVQGLARTLPTVVSEVRALLDAPGSGPR